MAMSKTAPITTYFQKLNQVFQRKRPLPEESANDSRENLRRKSSPSSGTNHQNPQYDSHSEHSSSQSSAPTPAKEEEESPRQVSSGPRILLSQEASTPSSIEPDFQSRSDHPFLPNRRESPQSLPKPLQENSKPDSEDAVACGGQPIHTLASAREDEATRPHAPTSSQTILTSSQRVVRNGETMIRNSDDESDDSLEDIDERLRDGFSSRESPPGLDTQSPHLDDGAKSVMRSSTRMSTRNKNAPSPVASITLVQPKPSRFSLGALAKQKKRDDTAEDDIARARSMFETYNERKASTATSKRVLDENVIDSIMRAHGDEDDISRLKNAIQRTEALQHAKSWSFFASEPDISSSQEAEFPETHDEQLARLFAETLSRQQTFLSGFAGEYAMKRGLPDDMLLWIADAICMEPRDDLRYSYVSTLDQGKEHTAPLLSAQCIERLFQKLGASSAALDLQSLVVPYPTLSRSIKHVPRPGLLSFLSLLNSLAGDISIESRSYLLSMLCRLALDDSITENHRALTSIGDTIENLVESLAEEELADEIQTVMTSVYHTVTDSSLRLLLFQVIPARSPHLISLRQCFALAFFFQDHKYLSNPANPTIDLATILQHLKSAQFNVTPSTDFDDLTARISMLSICIDSVLPPTPGNEEERAFNRSVDALASRINTLFSDIIDTGASHMKKTEAKDTLERFQRVLEYAVRTKPKAKKIIFGSAEYVPLQDKIQMQENMHDYLKGTKVAG